MQNSSRSRKVFRTLFISLVPALLFMPLTTMAAEFVVTSEADSGPGTLRQAVLDANANGNPLETDIITFAPNVKHIHIAPAPPPDSLGPLQVLESLHVQGPGRENLVVDGGIAWVSSDGVVNTPFIDNPGTYVFNNSGKLFEVGIFGAENTGLMFTLSGLTVTRTGGIVQGRQNTQINILDIRGHGNAWNPDHVEALISGGKNSGLTIRDTQLDGNQYNQGLIIAYNLVMSNTILVNNTRSSKATWGIYAVGNVTEITDSQILDTLVTHQFQASQTYITNSVIRRTQEHITPLMEVINTDLHLVNTTIYGISTEDRPSGPGQPSHLWLKNSTLYLANTVVADESASHAHPVMDMVRLDSASTLDANSSNYHVNDGSLAGASTGNPMLEGPFINPRSFKPIEGSSLIDAGDNALAVIAGSNPPETIQNDVLGNNRIQGPAVDIGAVEVQANHAVNDAYIAWKDIPLNISAPGVLDNDIVFGTLNPDEIFVLVQPTHGTLATTALSGGFQYTPEAGYLGADSFTYFFNTNEGNFSNRAVVSIAVSPPSPSRILVDKITAPSGSPQSFNFALTGGPGNTNQAFSLTDIDAPHDSGELQAGTYVVTEADAEGWNTHSSCDDGSGTHSIDPNTIDLQPGTTVTCSFVNVELDSIAVEVTTTPPGGTGFTFSHDIGTPGSFGLDDGQTQHFDSVTAGGYTITQDDPAPLGFDLVDIVCNGDAITAADVGARTVTITTTLPGETAHCTFVQEAHVLPPGRIITDLATDPSGDLQTFDFLLFGPDLVQGFSLTDEQSPRTSGDIPAGIYQLSPVVPDGWQLDGIVCDDGSDPWSIDLQHDETVTCTVTQSRLPGPSNTEFLVTKTFEDGSTGEVEVMLSCNGGLPLEQSFTIQGGGPGVTFTVTDVADGTSCTVTETQGPDNYTPIYNGGAGCTFENVTVARYPCQITNTGNPATYTVNTSWSVGGPHGGAPTSTEVQIICDQYNGGVYDDVNDLWVYLAHLGDGESATVDVETSQATATCWATTPDLSGGVMTDNQCEPVVLSAGDSRECDIVYSVFFEGIPTLDRFGVAVLVLLMLGLGFVGIRRFT